MIIAEGRSAVREYYTVQVCSHELVVASGTTLPYSAWIGTIDRGGTTLYPAAYRPVGYNEAAQALLDKAHAEVYKEGRVWIDFTRRTGDPKLTWLQLQLEQMGIPSLREGYSYHAPIMKVPDSKLDEAWNLLHQPVEEDKDLDDIPDDHPMFRPPYFEAGLLVKRIGKDMEGRRC